MGVVDRFFYLNKLFISKFSPKFGEYPQKVQFIKLFIISPNWLSSDSYSKFSSQLLLAIEFFNIISFHSNLFLPSLSSHLFIFPISLSLSLCAYIYRSSLRFWNGSPTSYLTLWIPKKEGPLSLSFLFFFLLLLLFCYLFGDLSVLGF
jgi:hypothetical protein